MYDVIIIGSGPAGMSAAVYAVRAQLDTLVIEKGAFSGGQIVNSHQVDNYLGMQGVSGFEMAMQFRKHMDSCGTKTVTGEVQSVQKCEDRIEVSLENDTVYETKTVVIATGAHSRRLEIPGEDEFVGRGISYCATCDGAFYRDKTVAVIGGGDVALGDAIYLSRLCKKVILVHRRDSFRGAAGIQNEVLHLANIEIQWDSTIQEVIGDSKVEHIRIQNIKTKQESMLQVDGVFVAIGYEPATEMLVQKNDLCDEKGYIIADENCKTKVAGIFAAGDVREKLVRQVSTAVADGALSIYSVEQYLQTL